eukprot:jgi/Antlo1/1871/621
MQNVFTMSKFFVRKMERKSTSSPIRAQNPSKILSEAYSNMQIERTIITTADTL